MVYFFILRTFYPNSPWPGTHEPASASARAAQRFERSENALGVAAGLIEAALHSVWCIFLFENFLSEQGLGLGRMSRLALQRVRRSGSSAVRTPLML